MRLSAVLIQVLFQCRQLKLFSTMPYLRGVIPAQAESSFFKEFWIPACVGVTTGATKGFLS
jgi:hypothetical protein